MILPILDFAPLATQKSVLIWDARDKEIDEHPRVPHYTCSTKLFDSRQSKKQRMSCKDDEAYED